MCFLVNFRLNYKYIIKYNNRAIYKLVFIIDTYVSKLQQYYCLVYNYKISCILLNYNVLHFTTYSIKEYSQLLYCFLNYDSST